MAHPFPLARLASLPCAAETPEPKRAFYAKSRALYSQPCTSGRGTSQISTAMAMKAVEL